MQQPACDSDLERAPAGQLDFLEEHLNLQWLRPESALCDAIASHRISQVPVVSPSMDLGCGNGLFSFITAGGKLSPEFDLYRNAESGRFKDQEDRYDCFLQEIRPGWILKKPIRRMDWGLDIKIRSLAQARGLQFYRRCAVADAGRPLPFQEASFQTLFCNMPYWLKDPSAIFSEITRLLRAGGQALLCFPDPLFKEYCFSFQPKGEAANLLRQLNQGRAASIRWTLSTPEWMSLVRKNRFKVRAHSTYYSPLTLRVWDVGLRPVSSALIRMARALSEADRASAKQEWIEAVRPILKELLCLEAQDKSPGGFHFLCLEKEP